LANILDLYKDIINIDALKEDVSDFIDKLPVDRKTYLDPKQDRRFTLIRKNEEGSGSLTIKLLPFVDKNNPKHIETAIAISKHSSYINEGGSLIPIHENCPKTIGNECALCDNIESNSAFRANTRYILNGIVVENKGYTDDVYKLKLIELTPTLLGKVASDDKFMNLFDIDSNLFLKIIIKKDSESGYYTYDDSYIYESKKGLDPSKLDIEEPFYSDILKEELYGKSQYLSYDRMILKYINKYVDQKEVYVDEVLSSIDTIPEYESKFSSDVKEINSDTNSDNKKEVKKRGRPPKSKNSKPDDEIKKVDIDSLLDNDDFFKEGS
jgi:hypothetical protein